MEIVHYPHPILRHKTKPVMKINDELREIAEEMKVLMTQSDGVGLAAIQVGLPLRLYVMKYIENIAEDDIDQAETLVFINPAISRKKGMEISEEGCLSFPKLFMPVRRATEIQLTGYDLNGEKQSLRLQGFPARVAQHECDHLNGIVFTDRVEQSLQESVEDALYDFELAFRKNQQEGKIADDATLMEEIEELEKKWC